MLSLASMEFVAVRVCVELVFRLFCDVASSAPTVDPYIPRAKRPPRYFELFLTWINDGIDRFVDKVAPWIIVRRRYCFSGDHSSTSRDFNKRRRYFRWRLIFADLVFWC